MVPLVSIVIPVYNCEKYIADTLQSCLEQSYENIEVLIIDDGSIDNTSNIINQLKDRRIKYQMLVHVKQEILVVPRKAVFYINF